MVQNGEGITLTMVAGMNNSDEMEPPTAMNYEGERETATGSVE